MSDTAHVDIIVSDYENGLQRRRRLIGAHNGQAHPSERVLIVTPRSSEFDIREAFQAGVHGYLVQGCSRIDTIEAVKALARGSRYCCSLASQRMADSFSLTALTEREADVLTLLCDGLSNKLIARQLDLGVGTVKTHVRAIFGKLDATSRTHAVVLAAQRGLVPRAARLEVVCPSEPLDLKFTRENSRSNAYATTHQV